MADLNISPYRDLQSLHSSVNNFRMHIIKDFSAFTALCHKNYSYCVRIHYNFIQVYTFVCY